MQPHRDRMPPVDYELPADFEAARSGLPPASGGDRAFLFLCGLVLGATFCGIGFLLAAGAFRPPF